MGNQRPGAAVSTLAYLLAMATDGPALAERVVRDGRQDRLRRAAQAMLEAWDRLGDAATDRGRAAALGATPAEACGAAVQCDLQSRGTSRR